MKKKRKKGITLVLSGGGAKGLAHIGVIEELIRHKIKINRIIGTSFGALVGGFYAAGKLKGLKEIFLNLTKWETFKLIFRIPSRNSLFNSRKVDKILETYLKDLMIQDLKIPFEAVAYNLSDNKRRIFTKGSLFNAIRASISIPGIFEPYKIENSLFIDGGVIDVVPTDIAKNYKEKIIAVNAETNRIMEGNNFNIIRLFDIAIFLQSQKLAKLEESDADFIIRPKVSAGHFDFFRSKKLIGEGKKATREAIPKIQQLLK